MVLEQYLRDIYDKVNRFRTFKLTFDDGLSIKSKISEITCDNLWLIYRVDYDVLLKDNLVYFKDKTREIIQFEWINSYDETLAWLQDLYKGD